MSLLTAMQSASMRLVGYRPSVFFSSQNQFEQEIVDLVNEVAKDCVASEDWQSLTRMYSINGDGTTENFPFPSDYNRQLLNSDIQDFANWAWGYIHITDINDFEFRRSRGFEPFPGAWIIYGNQFHFSPAPASGNTASFPYISKNYAIDESGASKPEFTADSDNFALDDRLLTLGLIWKWRENKKFDSTGDQENFQKCIDELATRDKGSKIIRSGRRWNVNASIAYPWTLG